MRKLILLAVFVLFPQLQQQQLVNSPLPSVFSSLNTADSTTCTASPCSITVPTTVAGQPFIIGADIFGGQTTNIVTVSGCATSVGVVRGSISGHTVSGGDYADMAYCLDATGGSTSLSVTFTSGLEGANSYLFYWSPSSTQKTYFDNGAGVVDSTACTSCAGPTFSLNGGNDFVATEAICGGTCTAVGSPYTSVQSFPGGDGMAYQWNATSAGSFNWTQSSSELVSAGMALTNKITGPRVVKGYGYSCLPGTATTTCTLPDNFVPEGPNHVVVVFYGAVISNDTGTCSISDGTNTYTASKGPVYTEFSSGNWGVLYTAYVSAMSTTGVEPEVTCTESSTNLAMMFEELAGVSTVDVSGMSAETSGSGGSVSGSSFETTNEPEILLGFIACFGYCSAGSGWSQFTGDTDGSDVEYQLALSGTVTKTATFTDSAGSGNQELVAWMSFH